MSEALKQIRVNQAAPLLENTITGFRSDARRVHGWLPSWLQLLCDERRIPILVRVDFGGYDLSVYIVFADPNAPSV